MKTLLLCLLLVSSPAWAANALVQKALSTGTGATRAATLAGAVTTGNFIAVGVVSDGATESITVADQAANAYTVIGPCTNTGRAWVAYRANVPGTGAGVTTITATFSPDAGAPHSIWVREFSGIATASPIDVSSVVSCSGTGTTINLPSITPTVSGDLLYAVTFYGGAVTATGGSWAAADGNIQNGEADEYILSGTTSATTVNWAGSPSSAWAAAIASFKTAVGGATCSNRMALMGAGQC